MPPRQTPPTRYRGEPHRFVLPLGTLLTRIHDARFDVTEFNGTVPARNRGGRFDSSPQDEYAFLYAASDDQTAVSEALLRDIPADERGVRTYPRVRLRGRRVGWIRTTCELQLASLRSGSDLAAVGQDTWLTNAPAEDYALTRQWAAAIRGWAPWAQGLTWRSRREPEGFGFVLFEDRVAGACLVEAEQGTPLHPEERSLESALGRVYVEEIMSRYRVTLM